MPSLEYFLITDSRTGHWKDTGVDHTESMDCKYLKLGRIPLYWNGPPNDFSKILNEAVAWACLMFVSGCSLHTVVKDRWLYVCLFSPPSLWRMGHEDRHPAKGLDNNTEAGVLWHDLPVSSSLWFGIVFSLVHTCELYCLLWHLRTGFWKDARVAHTGPKMTCDFA